MLKKIIISAIFATMGVSPVAFAQTETTTATVQEMATSQKTESLSDWRNEFEDRSGYKIGQAKNGKTFYFGQAVVNVPPTDPNYGKELQIAYEKAIIDLQGKYIKELYGKITAERIATQFKDRSSNARDFDPVELENQVNKGQIGQIFDKMLQVTENKLDAMLSEQGVPEEDIQRLQVEQKKKLYQNNFVTETMTRAFGSMTGLVPYQTKIASRERNGKSTVSLGVIAIISDKTQQFAYDIAKKRPSTIKGTPKALNDVVPTDSKTLMDQYGLRFTYDEQGRPMLISFGRWAVSGKEEDPVILEGEIGMAKDQARMTAETDISFFINSSVAFNEKTTKGSIKEKVITKVSEVVNNKVDNEDLSEKTITESIDKFAQETKARTKSDLRGTSQVRTWEHTDENGIIHVGSVVTWTYGQLDNANAQINRKNDSRNASSSNTSSSSVPTRESKVINSVEDF